MTAAPLPRRALSLAGLALLAAPRPAGAEDGAGHVLALVGEAAAERRAQSRALSTGAPVFMGETVTTAAEARLGLRLGADTELRLGGGVRLRIDRYLAGAGGLLVLERGGMLLQHGPADGAGSTAIRSPFALMAVRGTRFFAGPSQGAFGVLVLEGEVLVIAAETTVELTPGLGTNIATPGSAPTPPVFWGAGRIQAALASVT
jgi:hypothetical protein